MRVKMAAISLRTRNACCGAGGRDGVHFAMVDDKHFRNCLCLNIAPITSDTSLVRANGRTFNTFVGHLNGTEEAVFDSTSLSHRLRKSAVVPSPTGGAWGTQQLDAQFRDSRSCCYPRARCLDSRIGRSMMKGSR